MACSTCTKPSHYVYRLTDKVGIEYCDRCLPKFLEDRKKAGLLQTTDTYNKIIEEGLKNIQTVYSSSEPVVEPVDEPVTEVPAEPKKKATKKKAE